MAVDNSYDKNYIVDPFTTLCKLALFNFLPEETKMGIGHHIVDVQKYTYFQWIVRKKNGDTWKDFSNLIVPIIKSIEWYILDGPNKVDMSDETNENMKIIANFSIGGLLKLQKTTYKNNKTIRIVLQYSMNLIRDAINDTWNEENLIEFDSYNNILSDKIKKNFDPDIINSIAKNLSDAKKIQINDESDKNIKPFIDCVHELLSIRDEQFSTMMRLITTTL